MSENVCRICAKSTHGKHATKLFDNQNQNLLIQIKDITGLKNSLGLPDVICSLCKMDLITAYQFRENFLKIQASFKIRGSRANKKQKPNGLIQATEFVQVFVVKEEKNISSANHEDIHAYEEKEINFNETEELNKRQNFKFLKEDIDEINALELKPNEENTLNDSKFDLERNCDVTDDDIVSAKTLSDDGNLFKDSDDQCSVQKNNNFKVRKSKLFFKNKQSNKSSENDDNIQMNITKPKKSRKDADEHSNMFICDQCGNHFTCRHHFKLHLRRHTGDKRCACELCPDKFFTSSELRRHMRRHTGERPFACKYCERRFTDYSTRIKHERTHTNERPFMCSQCGKSFTTSYILKNHMLTHTGERHFRCDVCNKAFTRRTHLVVHFRSIMHKQAVEKLKCPILHEEVPQSNSLLPQPTNISSFLV
ncbi:uncharacterized protein ACRADG_000867 isoform 2-T2 [Cochliomyia hominivorax]